jgi:hypothetical protein
MDGAEVTVAVTVIRDSEVIADESYEVLCSAYPLDREGLRQSVAMSIEAEMVLSGLDLQVGDMVTAQVGADTQAYMVDCNSDHRLELIDLA